MDTDYLPLGGHLLPEEFQTFLVDWNMAIAAYSSEVGEDAWQGESRREYQKDNPELWEAYMAEFNRLNTRYSAEVKALKAYQKEYKKAEALETQAFEAARAAEAAEVAEKARVVTEAHYAVLAAQAAAAAADAEESVLYPLPAHGGQDAQDAYADEVGCGCCPRTAACPRQAKGKGWCAICKEEKRSHCECGYIRNGEC
jgi:hypothetical protein